MTHYLTGAQLAERLANAGGAGSRTAAALPETRLDANAYAAEATVLGRLRAFTLPPADSTDVPELLRDIVAGFAGYTATLEFYGSQPLEDRDPVVLRYTYAREQLRDLAAGTLVVDGIDPATGGGPVGDPETYQQTPDLGLAAGLFDGGGYGGHAFVSRPYGGGMWGG